MFIYLFICVQCHQPKGVCPSSLVRSTSAAGRRLPAAGQRGKDRHWYSVYSWLIEVCWLQNHASPIKTQEHMWLMCLVALDKDSGLCT